MSKRRTFLGAVAAAVVLILGILTLSIFGTRSEPESSHAFYRRLHQKVKSQIAAGADVEVRYDYGWTALHVAVMEHDKALANLLLDKGANVDVQDNTGRTPLMLAVIRCDDEMTRLLLSKHPDLEKRTFEGSTALMFAKNGCSGETVKLLLAAGAKVDTKQ